MTTTPLPPTLRLNARNVPYAIQSLSEWDTHLAKLVTPAGLMSARTMLLRGWEGMASSVPFFPNTPEADLAWKALNFRAYKMGFRFDRMFQRYVER